MFALIAQTSSGSSPVGMFVMFALLGGLFYLFLLRPQQRRAKAQQALISSVEVGDEIITTSGIYGTVTSLDEEEGTVTVQIAPGAEIRMLRAGIGRLAVEDDGAYEDDDESYDEDEPQPSISDGSQEYPEQPGQIKEL